MKGSETSSVEPVDWRTERPLTKGSETSNVEPVDWRTEKPLTKGTDTSNIEPVNWRTEIPLTKGIETSSVPSETAVSLVKGTETAIPMTAHRNFAHS